jgi:hypothetical protein
MLSLVLGLRLGTENGVPVVPRISSTLRGFRLFLGGSTVVSEIASCPEVSIEKSSVSGFSLRMPLQS